MSEEADDLNYDEAIDDIVVKVGEVVDLGVIEFTAVATDFSSTEDETLEIK